MDSLLLSHWDADKMKETSQWQKKEIARGVFACLDACMDGAREKPTVTYLPFFFSWLSPDFQV